MCVCVCSILNRSVTLLWSVFYSWYFAAVPPLFVATVINSQVRYKNKSKILSSIFKIYYLVAGAKSLQRYSPLYVKILIYLYSMLIFRQSATESMCTTLSLRWNGITQPSLFSSFPFCTVCMCIIFVKWILFFPLIKLLFVTQFFALLFICESLHSKFYFNKRHHHSYWPKRGKII